MQRLWNCKLWHNNYLTSIAVNVIILNNIFQGNAIIGLLLRIVCVLLLLLSSQSTLLAALPEYVLFVSPGEGAKDVLKDSKITIAFDKPVIGNSFSSKISVINHKNTIEGNTLLVEDTF